MKNTKWFPSFMAQKSDIRNSWKLQPSDEILVSLFNLVPKYFHSFFFNSFQKGLFMLCLPAARYFLGLPSCQIHSSPLYLWIIYCVTASIGIWDTIVSQISKTLPHGVYILERRGEASNKRMKEKIRQISRIGDIHGEVTGKRSW